MPLTSVKRTDNSLLSWRWMWLGLALLLLAGWPATGLGQEFSIGEMLEEAPENAPFGEQWSGRTGRAFGGVVRGGFVTGPGIGRDDGFAPLEYMPYFSVGDGMILGDLRGFRSTDDKFGFNTGLGYRHYVRGWDRILGFNAFYDYDNTSSQLFRQIGFGAETYGELWDMRLNTYFPVTEDTKELSLEFLPESLRYSGNNILFDQVRTFGVHMKGLDHEIGVPLPGRLSERHRVRGYAGWYYFQGRDVDHVWGWKGRLQGDLTSHINLGLEVTNDATFDTNVIFSVAVSYGGFKQRDGEEINQFDRMTTPIQRQYTAVVAKNPVLESGLVALKPDGTPYFVEHVASEPPYNRANVRFDPTAPLGSFENPFFTIQEAQAAAGGDIIFAWTNSVFDNMPVTIESGVQTLGEADGVVHTFLLQPFGFVNLPRANNNPDPNVAELRPLMTNIVGDAVTLSSGIALPNGTIVRSEFSGFRIGEANDPTSGPTGNGIVGDNVTGVDVRFNEVNFAGLDGVLLNGVGELAFLENRINNAAGNGLHVIGGQPRVTFEGDGDNATPELFYDLAVPGGQAVLIENTQAGSLVNLFGTSPANISYTNAGGVRVVNANGSARFGDITLTNTVTSVNGAIDIFNSTGAYTFSSPILITNPSVDGINIEQMSGQTTFQDSVTITNRQFRGLDFQFNSGDILFTDTDTGVVINVLNNATSPTEAALEYQGSSGDVDIIGPLNIDVGLGHGIVIGTTALNAGNPIDNTGDFTVGGGTSITNIVQTSLLIIDDQSDVQFDNFSINERGTALQRNGFPAMLIDSMQGDVDFQGITNIGNTLNGVNGASLDIAAQFLDNSGDITFNQLTIADANAPAFQDAVAGLDIRGTGGVGSYTGTVDITDLSITSTSGKALFARAVGDQSSTPLVGGIFTDGGTIDSTFETAIDIEDSVIGLRFDSVSSTQSQGPGINLQDNAAGRVVAFAVDPGTDLLGSGGQIIQSLTFGGQLGDGALFRNTGSVTLRGMDFIQNGERGVVVENVLSPPGSGGRTSVGDGDPILLFRVQTAQFIQNDLEGLRTLNVPNVNVFNALFTQNGGTILVAPNVLDEFPEIELLATVAPDDVDSSQTAYIYNMDNIEVRQTAIEVTNAIRVANLNGGPDTPLVLTLTDSIIDVPDNSPFLSFAELSNLEVVWTGPINAFINNNQFFNSQDPGGNGIEILAQSLFDLADIEVSANDFQINGNVTRAFILSSLGPSTTLFDFNAVNMNGNLAFATLFTLGAGSNTTLSRNDIVINGDGSEGFVFNSIVEPALVNITSNAITLNGNLGGANEIGIDFRTTQGVIEFAGGVNNVITINGFQSSGFPWFSFPANGDFNGSFLINNILHP